MHDMGSKIKNARESRGLSQEELGEKISRSSSAISSYECNVQSPPIDVLLSIAGALNVSINYLVEWDNGDLFSTAKLDDNQKQFLELLFREFTLPTVREDNRLSDQQIELARRLFELFKKD